MTKAQLIALMVRDGIPAAIQVVRILKVQVEDVSEEDWNELQQYGALRAEDFKRERQ
jgi:hypothetical protein